MPTPQQVDSAKGSINDLDAPGKETYKLLLSIYKEDLAIAKQALDTIQAVRKHLVTTVSARNIVCINDKNTVYQMLSALKKRLAPTDYARKLELAQRYRKLKTFTKKDRVERWLRDWGTTFVDGKRLNIPEVADERPLFDFTHAVSTLDSGFSSSQKYFVTQKIRNKETLPDLYDLIEDFRNHYRRNEALKPSGSHSAFATLNGESQDGERKDNDKKDDGKKEKTCHCGGNHGPGNRIRWDKCYYITPKTRPPEWTGMQ